MNYKYIQHYIEHYKVNGRDGCGAGLVDKADRLKKAGYKNSMTLLDYGCGRGAILEGINPKDYLGVDIVPQAIEMARKDFPDRRFEVLGESGLKAVKKDFAIALSVFSHTKHEDVEECLGFITKLLKKDGTAVVDILEGNSEGNIHIRYWLLEEFEKELKKVGLIIKDSFKITSDSNFEHTYLICKFK